MKHYFDSGRIAGGDMDVAELPGSVSTSASVIISVAVMLFSGLLMT